MKNKLNVLLTAGIFLSICLINNIQAATSDAELQKEEASEQKPEKPKASKFTILTENFPPFNYIEEGKLLGISTEIVQEILNRLNLADVPITVSNWDEAYQTALEKPNTILFSLTRINQRENKFKWVGPIVTNYWYLFSLKQPVSEKKNKTISLRSLKDAKKHKIGVQAQGAIFLYLKGKGFTDLVASTTNEKTAEALLDGSVQLWGEGELGAASILKQLNKDPNILQKELKLRKQNMYIGFNLKTPDIVVSEFQKTLDQMKNDGTYDKIVNKYYNEIYGENVKEDN